MPRVRKTAFKPTLEVEVQQLRDRAAGSLSGMGTGALLLEKKRLQAQLRRASRPMTEASAAKRADREMKLIAAAEKKAEREKKKAVAAKKKADREAKKAATAARKADKAALAAAKPPRAPRKPRAPKVAAVAAAVMPVKRKLRRAPVA